MTEFSVRVGDGRYGSALYLIDEGRYVFVTGLEDIPRVGTEVVIDDERWRVVAWTDRIECELMTR